MAENEASRAAPRRRRGRLLIGFQVLLGVGSWLTLLAVYVAALTAKGIVDDQCGF